MTGLLSIHRRARCLYAIVLLPLAASCSTWRQVPGVGLARVERERIGPARVFLRDGTALDLEDATISTDSIIGLGGTTSTRWAAARRDVVKVDTRRTEPATTILGGVLAGFVTLWVLIST